MSGERCGAPTKSGNPCQNPSGSCPHHNKGGRPTKYRQEYNEHVYKLCLLGATDEQLADFFDVSVQTIHNWVDAHPGFLESRKRGKEEADARVAESLFHRALGYEHDAVKITSDGDYFPYRKRYPPDTGAAAFWLKNRQPDKWRDRKEHEHSGPGGGPIQTEQTVDLSQLDTGDLKLLKQLRARASATTKASGGNGSGP